MNLQIISRAARAHPLEMINSPKGPRCTTCKLVAANPELKRILMQGGKAKNVSRARWHCTKCDQFICSRNPALLEAHPVQLGVMALTASAHDEHF